MRTIAISLLLGFLICGCNSPKKPVTTPADNQFDYRDALNSFKIGVNYLNNNEVMNAIRHLERAVSEDGGNYRYHHSLGLAYVLNGRFEDAERELKQSVAINPENPESYNLLGTLYIDLGRYDEAVIALRKAIADKSYPQPHFPYFNYGLAMQKQGKLDQAKAAYLRAVRLKADFYRAYLKLGEVCKQEKNMDEALMYFLKAERGYPDNAELLYQVGHTLFVLKRYGEAKHYLAQLTILFPPPHIDNPARRMLRLLENVSE